MNEPEYAVVVPCATGDWYISNYSDRTGDWYESPRARRYTERRAKHIASEINKRLRAIGVCRDVAKVVRLD